jgi:hypothetical protein
MACSSEEPRKNRHLTAVALEHAFSNQARSNYLVASDQKLAPGKDAITFDFTYDGGSVARSGRLDLRTLHRDANLHRSVRPQQVTQIGLRPLGNVTGEDWPHCDARRGGADRSGERPRISRRGASSSIKWPTSGEELAKPNRSE